MWEHELPLSRTPTLADRDSGIRPATRVTRFIIHAILLKEENRYYSGRRQYRSFSFSECCIF